MAGAKPLLQSGHQITDSWNRTDKIRQIVNNIGVRTIQVARGRVVAVTFFGYGERYNTNGRVSHQRHQRSRIFRPDEGF